MDKIKYIYEVLSLERKEMNFSIVQITDTSISSELLDLVKRSTIYFAHEANISLYSKSGGYNIPDLNETRGDYNDAIINDIVLAITYRNRFVAHVRLISDYESGKSLMTRFAIDPEFKNMNLESALIKEASKLLLNKSISEAYIYCPTKNKYYMDILKKNRFMPYSVNDGYPYPIVCLVKRLYRSI